MLNHDGRSIWARIGIDLGVIKGRFGVGLESIWGRSEIDLGSIQCRSWSIRGRSKTIRGRSKVDPVSIQGRSGVDLGFPRPLMSAIWLRDLETPGCHMKKGSPHRVSKKMEEAAAASAYRSTVSRSTYVNNNFLSIRCASKKTSASAYGSVVRRPPLLSKQTTFFVVRGASENK
jgi:hypothetical protein